LGGTSIAQNKTEEVALTEVDVNHLLEKEKEAAEWLKALRTPGVKVTDSSMVFSEEARRLLKDEAYRQEVYKDVYTFQDVKRSLSLGEYQKGFWQMLNLYPDHKEDVVRFIYAYDNAFPTDEVVVASFYTYGFFDPRITKLDGDKPNVYRPDIFEEYLRRTREIVSYILIYRKEAQKAKG
jgi:hypothetical protein